MDEYIEQLLAEMPEPAQKVVRNIKDKPICGAVKQRLLKNLLPGKPRPSCPPRMRKDRKRKAILKEFGPLPPQKDYQQEILEVFEQKKRHEQVFFRTPWVIGKFLRGWQMDVPLGHPHGIDPRAFLKEVHPLIKKKLIEEILDLGGVKFQLALKVQLQKESPDGTEEFIRNKQEAPLPCQRNQKGS